MAAHGQTIGCNTPMAQGKAGIKLSCNHRMGEGGYKNSICADVLPRREPNEVKLKWYTYAGAQEWVRRNNRFDSYRLKWHTMECGEIVGMMQRLYDFK